MYDPLPPIQCWKRCFLVCVQMVRFCKSTSKNTSNMFGNCWKHLFVAKSKQNQHWFGGGGREIWIFTHRKWFCRDHCVLVMINHQSVPIIYGSPLVSADLVGQRYTVLQQVWHGCRFSRLQTTLMDLRHVVHFLVLCFFALSTFRFACFFCVLPESASLE